MSLVWNKEANNIVSTLQHNLYQRKTIYNPYKKRFQPIQQKKRQNLPAKLPYFPSTQSYWIGDTMTRNPSKGHLRFWVQNCNGLKVHDESNLNHTFTQLHEHGVGFFSFTETNVNVSNPNAVSKINRIFRSRFKSGRMTLTNTPKFPRSTAFQPGGTFSGFTSDLNTRFISSTKDKFGRWHCQTLRGKDRDICIYTIYRVHRKSDDTAGLTSAWTQQRQLLREDGILRNPRDDVIDSTCASIRNAIQSDKAVILMGNFNEGITSKENTHTRLTEIGMVNVMNEWIESDLPKTWNRGITAIDHVYTTIDVFKSIRKAGFAPFDVISLSGHRGIFFDSPCRPSAFSQTSVVTFETREKIS